MTGEFSHYDGCNFSDPDNCSACALTRPTEIDHGGGVTRRGINYAAWPLSYIQNGRRIPEEFYGFLVEEFLSDNEAYVKHLIETLKGTRQFGTPEPST
jgi:hypothetical protein